MNTRLVERGVAEKMCWVGWRERGEGGELSLGAEMGMGGRSMLLGWRATVRRGGCPSLSALQARWGEHQVLGDWLETGGNVFSDEFALLKGVCVQNRRSAWPMPLAAN